MQTPSKQKKRAEFTLCDHCASLHTRRQQTWYWEPISPVCDSFFPSKIQSHMHCVSLSNVGKNTKWQRQKETRRLLIAQHHLGVDGELEHSFRHRFLTPCSYLERTPASHEPDCSPASVCSPGSALLSSPWGLRVSFCA